jgi:hypothetical protein
VTGAGGAWTRQLPEGVGLDPLDERFDIHVELSAAGFDRHFADACAVDVDLIGVEEQLARYLAQFPVVHQCPPDSNRADRPISPVPTSRTRQPRSGLYGLDSAESPQKQQLSARRRIVRRAPTRKTAKPGAPPCKLLPFLPVVVWSLPRKVRLSARR